MATDSWLCVDDATTTPALVKGRGAELQFPALPLTLPVRVQLRASNGSCWESSRRCSARPRPA